MEEAEGQKAKHPLNKQAGALKLYRKEFLQQLQMEPDWCRVLLLQSSEASSFAGEEEQACQGAYGRFEARLG